MSRDATGHISRLIHCYVAAISGLICAISHCRNRLNTEHCPTVYSYYFFWGGFASLVISWWIVFSPDGESSRFNCRKRNNSKKVSNEKTASPTSMWVPATETKTRIELVRERTTDASERFESRLFCASIRQSLRCVID